MEPIDILLVEDNPGDVRLTREAFAEGRVANRLHVAEDGEIAVDYLKKRGEYQNVPTPDLILLDLNLPRKDGRAVLAEIKQDEHLLRIPVVILTSSQAEEDIVRSYNLHCNAYVPKPVDFERLIEVVRSIESFWLAVVKLPTEGHGA